MTLPEICHIPVLLTEVIELLEPSVTTGDSLVIDCTLGEGGHSEAILTKYPSVKLIGFERDPVMFERACKRLEKFGNRFEGINDNFSRIPFHLFEKKGKISAFLFDFGISSYHFDFAERGFSYARTENLDMRLDNRSDLTAAKIVNHYREKELADLIYKYGEERKSRQIASAIVYARAKAPITTTSELVNIILKVMPHNFKKDSIHPATRTFQALRIAVNDELGAIEAGLIGAFELLAPKGRILAISFHSLEDRIVKQYYKKQIGECHCGLDPILCRCDRTPHGKIITRKPVEPSEEEISTNRRSRSAKLRVVEKL